MVRILWWTSHLLRSMYDSYALIAAILVFTTIVGLVGYSLLHRKVAVIAASAAGLLLLGAYNLITAVANSLTASVLLVGLGILGGAGVLYGLYIFLVRAKRPWLMAIGITMISSGLSVVASSLGLYVVRMNFVP